MSSSSSPNKATGQVKSVIGTAQETFGNLTGMQGQADAGKQTHQEGESEVHAAEARNYAEGTIDRIIGKKDNVVGAITGDKSQQASGAMQETSGKMQQEANKPVS